MFGCIVAGRLVNTGVRVVAAGKYMLVLDQPATINHLVVFLTGERMFDAAFGASIYVNSDVGTSQGRPWRFLGVLSNDKPSAIFKLSEMHKVGTNHTNEAQTASVLEIGISIEPLTVLDQLLMENSSTAIVPVSTLKDNAVARPLVVAQRVGEHLFNYLISFARRAADAAATGLDLQVVPVKAVQDWYNSLVRRASTDPDGFLRQFSLDSA